MLSKRIQNMKNSIYSKYIDLINERMRNGIKFYKLNIGQPDFDTNPLYFESLSKFNQKVNSYGDPSGLNVLKASVSEYYNNLYSNISITENNVVITQGASDAIIKLLYCICDIDDEIIILEPFFADYRLYCDMLNIKIKTIEWNDLNTCSFEKIITNKTKAILFANPNNPDGSIINKTKANKLIKIANKYNLSIISDEVYSGLIYSNKYISFANYLDNNVIVVDSASKKLNLCGSRIGYIISKNEELNNKIVRLNDCRISISNAEQFAVSKMLKKANKIIEQSKSIYQNRIKIIQKKLNNSKIKCITPYGGITILLELPFDTEGYVKWLIEKYDKDNYSLLVTSASDFYLNNNGRNKIRICVTIDDKNIEKVIDLLIDSCTKYMEEEL